MIEAPEDVRALVEELGGELLEIGGIRMPVIWGDPYVEVPSGESSVASADSSATVAAIDAAMVRVGAVLVRKGVSYRVALKEPDGTEGTVRLTLDRVTV